MRIKMLFAALLMTSSALAEPLSPEADACKASSLLALKQKYPQVRVPDHFLRAVGDQDQQGVARHARSRRAGGRREPVFGPPHRRPLDAVFRPGRWRRSSATSHATTARPNSMPRSIPPI